MSRTLVTDLALKPSWYYYFSLSLSVSEESRTSLTRRKLQKKTQSLPSSRTFITNIDGKVGSTHTLQRQVFDNISLCIAVIMRA